jgi:hypothetical protein
MAVPDVTPLPPIASGLVLPWHGSCPDPVAAIGAARAEHGDTFIVDSGSDRYLFTFSPVGVDSFYCDCSNGSSCAPTGPTGRSRSRHRSAASHALPARSR